jgi:hypothetical protein
MTDETGSPAGGEAIYSTELPADAPESFDSPREAAEYFTNLKAKRAAEPAESAEEPATAEQESPARDDSDPETDPAEVPEEAEPEESPPIEPPRSWTKAEKERFQSLPRETQEYLHTREQEREREFRRSQNEIAEQRKAAQAERETAEKVRQQYEAQLPALMQTLLDAQQSSFADIKSVADVERLQAEDPFRFQAWQVQQMKLQAAHAETERVNGEKLRAQQSEWKTHVQKENELAAEYIPDLADKVKGPALTNRVATELLPELGFKDSELADLASGKTRLSIYDHRVQRLLADAVKLRDIQAAPKAIAAKPLPPVQRPGPSKPAGSSATEREQALNSKPELTVKEATELYQLQQRRTRRAS